MECDMPTNMHGKLTDTPNWKTMSYKDRVRWTALAMADPQPGDVFSEMLAFYAIVVARYGDMVEYLTGNPPCTFPDENVTRHRCTVDGFGEHFGHGARGGSWVTLLERGADVAGWSDGDNI